MKKQEETFIRFSLNSRLGHLGMMISFIILAITGLPQKFHSADWAQAMVALMGGIEFIRLIHRWTAALMIAVSVYHLVYAGYVLFRHGSGAWQPILPSWRDVKDVFQMVLYLFGRRKDKPLFDTFSYKEKFDYWAVFWGMVIMAGSGLILWFPTIATRWLPGAAVPIAKTAHSDEALLAVLAIVFWHMYNVHFNVSVFPFNASIFTGKISSHHMIEEHPLEYARLKGVRLDTLRQGQKAKPSWGAVIMSGLSGLAITALFLYLLVVGFQSPAPSPEAFQQAMESVSPVSSVALAAPANDETATSFVKAASANLHQTITEYEGPASCSQVGCHPDHIMDEAIASNHNQRLAVAGPNPWLAKLVEGSVSAGEDSPNCLVCHAQDFRADDLLASAQTVGAAGGKTCLRCHNHPEGDVHSGVGLACISCHSSANHQIQTEVACLKCHTDQPHADPFLNTKHERLDCRTCHTNNSMEIVVNASQPVQNPGAGFFEPSVEKDVSNPNYIWHTDRGQTASPDTAGAVIVPVVPVTILAPAGFDPAAFSLTGRVDGEVQEARVDVISSHGVAKENARACDTCHGPDGDFDFVSLGYDEAQADNLSAKSVAEETE